jgi:hypothetical protein
VPLALAAESFCAKGIISGCTIIPLTYNDGMESSVLSYCGIHGVPAERNGTVSGTAAEFALSLTSGPVFLCGLDLAASAGYQHAQPNSLETLNAPDDNRTAPKEGRISASRFSSQALSVYCSWFQSLPPEKAKRLFRLSDKFKFANSLGQVADTDFNFFAASAAGRNTFPVFTGAVLPPPAELVKKEKQFLAHNRNSPEWMHAVFPVDYLSLLRSSERSEKENKKNSLLKKNDGLIIRIERILHE